MSKTVDFNRGVNFGCGFNLVFELDFFLQFGDAVAQGEGLFYDNDLVVEEQGEVGDVDEVLFLDDDFEEFFWGGIAGVEKGREREFVDSLSFEFVEFLEGLVIEEVGKEARGVEEEESERAVGEWCEGLESTHGWDEKWAARWKYEYEMWVKCWNLKWYVIEINKGGLMEILMLIWAWSWGYEGYMRDTEIAEKYFGRFRNDK